MDKAKKKQIKKITTWVLLAALVAGLTAMPLLAKAEAVEIFDKVQPDPTVELAAEGTARLKAFGPDLVVALGGGSAGSQGTGGMATKLHAAEICLSAGCSMVITNGKRPDDLYAILEGRSIGTKFSRR